jgi:iron complex transport system substrate-binding protein
MRRYFILTLAYFSYFQSVYANCTLLDDLQAVVHCPLPAKRIISLSPDLTETLFAIGAGERIVGVVEPADYPPAARYLPRVGTYAGLDLERVITLHPDLVVRWGHTFERQVVVLKKRGIPVYTSDPTKMADIPSTMRRLGCLLGESTQAEKVAKAYEQRWRAIRQQYAGNHKQTVFLQIGTSGLQTVNKHSWISEAAAECGGLNPFGELFSSAPAVTAEALLQADPAVIISIGRGATWLQFWQRNPRLQAVRGHRLYQIDPDWLERPGPRLLDGFAVLCADLQLA